ncbi:MAG: TlpA family protein disulfide reductase [Clostridiales bacterium]|nr:TlpA family protein disulfide reductase [Clostridiales bacterium]
MKKYGKLIAGIFLLAAVIGVAAFIYGKLKDEMQTPSLVENQQTKEESGAKTDSSQKEPSAENDGTEKTDAGNQETENQTTGEQEAEDSTMQRQDAIDVKFYDSEGNPVQLSDFYGKPVVVNFWATWCGFCKQEMPDFQEVYDEYGEEVEFLLINSTDGERETREKAAAYLKETEITIPAFYDEDLEAVYTYSVNSLPTTILLDKNGKVAAYAPGMIQKEALVEALEVLLAEE